MKFVNPNELKKMGLSEDMHDQDHIWDWDQEIFENIEATIKNESHNIKMDLPEEFLSQGWYAAESRECLSMVVGFCDQLTDNYRYEFLSLLDECKNEKRQISYRMIDYLVEKNLVLPNFNIAFGENAQKLLAEYGLHGDVDDLSFLLTFQLPKPLSEFWWKDSNRSGAVRGSLVEWGHFYQMLMPIVWETQGYYEGEEGLSFKRINGLGQHDPKKYYYVWKVSQYDPQIFGETVLRGGQY